MKKLFTLLFLLSIGIFSFAQTNLITDDFESYTVGTGVAAQGSANGWTTWSNNPGSSEDPLVSDAQASNGTKSIKVITNNDAVLLLGDKTEGRFHYNFKMRVASNKIGYFNVLQDFAGSNSKWGLQITFQNGTATIDAGAAAAKTFTYTPDTWLDFRIIIDLDDDFATIYADGVHVYSYQWSLGATGSYGPKKIAAGNFFGHVVGSTQGEYYIDEVSFDKVVSPEPPQNLQSSINANIISLTWDQPTSGTPASYVIFRNGEKLAENVTTTTYEDILPNPPYPNTYIYTVKAYYDLLGYSASSNETTLEIPGGKNRELVLVEVGTGTWCQYCPGVAMGIDEFLENGKKIAPVKYHSGDSYEIQSSTDRLMFYGVDNFPTSIFDGILKVVGGNASASLYEYLLPNYEKRIIIPSTHTLEATINPLTPDNYLVKVKAEQFHNYFDNNIFLFTSLTESHIPENWLAGLTEVNAVNRGMFPTSSGTYLDFSSTTTHEVEIEFTLESGINKDNSNFVIWLQHMPTKEIIQTISFDMKFVSTDKPSEIILNVYPNPTSKYLNIEVNNTKPFTYYISNIQGQVVVPPTKMVDNIQKIDVSNWATGMYLIRTSNGLTKKFSVITK